MTHDEGCTPFHYISFAATLQHVLLQHVLLQHIPPVIITNHPADVVLLEAALIIERSIRRQLFGESAFRRHLPSTTFFNYTLMNDTLMNDTLMNDTLMNDTLTDESLLDDSLRRNS
ncbi:hypothetical protein K449DRAFT_430379 [Hypoxylon sp. EC38]|nr:hypothetical protein K449DRAFT_430379 [Hypoxylon sp. EC38]